MGSGGSSSGDTPKGPKSGGHGAHRGYYDDYYYNGYYDEGYAGDYAVGNGADYADTSNFGYAPYSVPRGHALRYDNNASGDYSSIVMSISLVFNVVLFSLLICAICSLCVAVYGYFICKIQKAQSMKEKEYGMIARRDDLNEV